MGHKNALLLDRLDWHEPHCWPLYGFADGLGIQRVALSTLYVGFRVGRQNQANFVPHCGERSCPIVRCSAGLHTDQAWRQLREERQHLLPV
jgi:hypothetical protein